MEVDTMNVQGQAGSARIYEFPKRGRFGEMARLGFSPDDIRAMAEVSGLSSDSWYHEAAVTDARGLFPSDQKNRN